MHIYNLSANQTKPKYFVFKYTLYKKFKKINFFLLKRVNKSNNIMLFVLICYFNLLAIS